MSEYTNHIERYQLDTLTALLDRFEDLMYEKVNGKMKQYEDYPTILLYAAGKSSHTLRAIIALCVAGLPDAALMLARQIYEQFVILSFFEQIKQQPDFQKYVKDYFADYDIQVAKYNIWEAEHIFHDSNKAAQWQSKIDKIKEEAYHAPKGNHWSDYWWTGMSTFKDVSDFLMDPKVTTGAPYMAEMRLLYMRSCKDVHASSLGNSLRLGSDSDLCGVDNSPKTSGYGLPLYFSVRAFAPISFYIFNNLGIDGDELLDEFSELEKLYAKIENETTE